MLLGDIPQKTMIEQDVIICLEIDFSDIQPQIRGIHDDFFQRPQRGDYHPVEGKGHHYNEKKYPGNSEEPDNAVL